MKWRVSICGKSRGSVLTGGYVLVATRVTVEAPTPGQALEAAIAKEGPGFELTAANVETYANVVERQQKSRA